jgi:hypothetical protein
MSLKHCDSVRSSHDISAQGNIRHLTGTGNVYQDLERLNREEARLQKQHDMWAARAQRVEDRIAQINIERRALLVMLEPAIKAAEQEVELL